MTAKAITYKTLTPVERKRSSAALLRKQNEELRRKVEFLEEELRVERETQRIFARRRSYGTGYQQ